MGKNGAIGPANKYSHKAINSLFSAMVGYWCFRVVLPAVCRFRRQAFFQKCLIFYHSSTKVVLTAPPFQGKFEDAYSSFDS